MSTSVVLQPMLLCTMDLCESPSERDVCFLLDLCNAWLHLLKLTVLQHPSMTFPCKGNLKKKSISLQNIKKVIFLEY